MPEIGKALQKLSFIDRLSGMKADIHPQFYTNVPATCACGAVFSVGSTKEKISVEICSNCHPFYTGKENLLDTAGRVERFKARQQKKKPAATKKTVQSKVAPATISEEK